MALPSVSCISCKYQSLTYPNVLNVSHRAIYAACPKRRNSAIVSKVSLSLSLEADCARDSTQGFVHRLIAITSCCTDGVQLTLQNLSGHLEMLCRRLATCILQQCRRSRGRILLQWLDDAPHWRVVTTDQRSEAPIPCLVRSSPFSVATCTFKVDTGNSGNSGRSVMRGTEAPSSSSSAAAAGR